jgi:thiol:disulfide interchange protein
MQARSKAGKIWWRAVAAALVILSTALHAQNAPSSGLPAADPGAPVKALHVTVQLVSKESAVFPPDGVDAGLYFKLDSGWHVYWQNAGDSGEPPRIKWTLPEGVTAGAIQYPAPQRLPLGPLMDYGYEKEVLFPIRLTADKSLKPGTTAHLGARVDWLVCREVCIPGKANVALDLPVVSAKPAGNGAGSDLFQRLEHTLPQPLPSSAQAKFQPTAAGFALTVLTGKKETAAQFFPFEQNQIDNPSPQTVTPLTQGLRIDLKKDQNLTATPKELHGLVVLADGTAYEVHAAPGALQASEAASTGVGAILRVVGLAFIGGIILNLMPCVFPVLFIKGLALVQSSGEERSRMRAHGWVYTLGILVSFWAVVALLLVLRAGGRQFGWGFQFQSPSFVAIMALLLFFLGLSLAGMFEIGLTLTSAGGSLASKSGYAGSFFTGILAMVVATPCTAPFMGAAIGFALAQPATTTFLVFTALGLGLAAPYVLLSFNPGWTRMLPRPGAWMEVLKQATAVPIFATVIWLVWLFAQAAGVNALIGLLGAFLLLAVAGWILGRWPAQRAASLIAALVVVAAIGLPIYAMQSFAAPTVKAAQAGSSDWEPFTPQLVENYRAQGRPVFVDFTASWCLSCQVNERVVLERADVQERLHASGIALVRADWTRHDETIAQALAGLGRSGVPTYALYSGSAQDPPQVLPEVLTPGIIFSALDGLKPTKQAELKGVAAGK